MQALTNHPATSVDRSILENEIAKIVAKSTDLSLAEIIDSKNIESIGIDSLTLTEIVIEIERTFEIVIADDKLNLIRHFQDFVALVIELTLPPREFISRD
jgi:acyl carrier protein